MLSNTTIIDKIKKNIQTCNIVFHPVVAFTVDNRSKLFHYSLPMHKSQSAPRRSTLFVAPKKKKKKKRKKKKIHTYLLRERDVCGRTARKLGSWLGGSVGLSLLKISFDNVRPTIPHPPNWVSCNATYTRFWINSTIYISIYMWNMDRRYKKKILVA